MIVRPDQYIADVLPLDAQDELAVCFDRILQLTACDARALLRPKHDCVSERVSVKCEVQLSIGPRERPPV